MDDRSKLPPMPPNEAAGIPMDVPTERSRREEEERERKRKEGKDPDEEKRREAPMQPWTVRLD
jgi:hypothetical protein